MAVMRLMTGVEVEEESAGGVDGVGLPVDMGIKCSEPGFTENDIIAV